MARAFATRAEASTRDVILDAAERRFAERGLAGVSMRGIAAEAGLRNQGSLYHHFRDKRALYEAVLERGLAPVVLLVGEAQRHWQAVSAGAPLDPGTVGDVLDRLFDYLTEHSTLPRLIQRAGLDDDLYLRSTLTRLLRPLYAEGMKVLAGTVGPWEPAELPHVAAGIYLLIFGYFTSAPLLEAVAEQEPHSPAAVARQRRFLKTAIAQLLGVRPVRRVPASRRRRP